MVLEGYQKRIIIRSFLKWNVLIADINILQTGVTFGLENVHNVNPQRKEAKLTIQEISGKLRYQVLKRDKFKCCDCGASPAKDVQTIALCR